MTFLSCTILFNFVSCVQKKKYPGKIEKNQESRIQFIDTKGEKNFKNSTLIKETEENKTAEKSLQLADRSLTFVNTIEGFLIELVWRVNRAQGSS